MRKSLLAFTFIAVSVGAALFWAYQPDRNAEQSIAGSGVNQGQKPEALKLTVADLETDKLAGAIAANPEEAAEDPTLLIRATSITRMPADVQADYWSINPLHNLKSYYTLTEGVQVRPYRDSDEAERPWSFGVGLAGVGTTRSVSARNQPALRIEGETIAYDYGDITEWYINKSAGLEQGFTVNQPPAGVTDELVLTLNISGDLKARILSDEVVAFDQGDGQADLYMRNLYVVDANDRELMAAFTTVDNRLSIAVDVTDAVYPVIVDPLITAIRTLLEADITEAQFGEKVASAGDVNGDGFADILVGVTDYGTSGSEEGGVFLYLGNENGIADTPAKIFPGFAETYNLGRAISTAGDINLDGKSDILIGAAHASPFPGSDDPLLDVVYVYFGSDVEADNGLLPTPLVLSADGNPEDYNFGEQVSYAGDINKDNVGDFVVLGRDMNTAQTVFWVFHGVNGGNPVLATGPVTLPDGINGSGGALFVDDWLVAAVGNATGSDHDDLLFASGRWENIPAGTNGAVFLYPGSGSGLLTDPGDIISVEGNTALHLEGFGDAISGVGDVDGDGFNDIVVSSNIDDSCSGICDGITTFRRTGQVALYKGGASLVHDPSWGIVGAAQADKTGCEVKSVGDVNGDGRSDLLVNSCNRYKGEIYLATSTGFEDTPAWEGRLNDTNRFQSQFTSVAAAGDINADGYADIVMGAPYFGHPQPREGVVLVYMGSPGVLKDKESIFDQNWLYKDPNTNMLEASLGAAVDAVGDVDGDGFEDFAVGAPAYSNGQAEEGAVFVYYGNGEGVDTSRTPWSYESGQTLAKLGFSVAAAGDVNADGFADVLVGAPLYDDAEVDGGAAFLFLGGSGAMTSNQPDGWPVYGTQPEGYLGHAVDGAGDINDDGYADVLLGEPTIGEDLDGFSGQDIVPAGLVARVYVYNGCGGCVAPVPGYATVLEGPNNEFGYGFAVASAGDVNRDGFDDVVIGHEQDNHAYLHLGSSTGISATPDWSATTTQWRFGGGVAGVGDVNNDGYDDVAVGAPAYIEILEGEEPGSGPAYAGGVFIFHGQADYPGLTPDPVSILLADENVRSGELAWAIDGAGDVNGDGYGDVIVGGSDYDNILNGSSGAAYVYLGAATGMARFPAWEFEGGGQFSNIGSAVSSAGDIDGDGLGDVLIGAPDLSPTIGGGNPVGNTFYIFSAKRGEQPIQLTQLDGSNDFLSSGAKSLGAFKAQLKAYPSPYAGDSARLIVENCALPASFSGEDCDLTEAAGWTLLGGAGTNLTLDIDPVATARYPLSPDAFPTDGMHRWRAKLEYKTDFTALPWVSRFTPWRYFRGDPAKAIVD
ncbi:MAG: FG-GAP-like repeat-containing protein, partial [Gammaproteobacteria bacterium]